MTEILSWKKWWLIEFWFKARKKLLLLNSASVILFSAGISKKLWLYFLNLAQSPNESRARVQFQKINRSIKYKLPTMLSGYTTNLSGHLQAINNTVHQYWTTGHLQAIIIISRLFVTITSNYKKNSLSKHLNIMTTSI